MLIEIQCGNFSRFDPTSGQYLECGEKLIVSDDKIGQFVTCSKCNQSVEVPYGIQSGSKPKLDQPPQEPKPKSTKSTSKKRKSKTSKPTSQSTNSVTSKSKRRPKSKIQPDDGELALAAEEPRLKAQSDVMSMDFGETEVASTLSEDSHDRCEKCGNVSVQGRCTVCRHVERTFDTLHKDLDDIKIELAGFQRWFCRTMNDGASLSVFEYGAHIGLGFLGLLLSILGIASVCGFGVGIANGAIILTLLLIFGSFYIGMIYKGKQFRRDPRAKLAWFQKPIWNGVLLFARAMKWQAYDGSLKGRTVITVNEKLFGDNEIADLEDFKKCSVLDLQGTSVTDRGLLELYSLKHLQCVVLRNTKVTHDGVFRLQQSFPKLWIWY